MALVPPLSGGMTIQNFARNPVLVNNRLSAACYRTQTLASMMAKSLFFFDAFDELGTQEARDLIAQHIGSLAASAPKGNRFIVTSRIVGYNGQLSQYGFRVL